VIACADLLRRAGRGPEARAAYLEARAMERNRVLAGFLDDRLEEIDQARTSDAPTASEELTSHLRW
jgi:predicted RNA polymerase sigma factor